MRHKNTLILIGPCRSGKTTVAQIISERISRPNVILDMIGQEYHNEIYDSKDGVLWQQYLKNRQFMEWFDLSRKYEIHVLERALSDHDDCVIDCGAGHSVFIDENHIQKASKILEPYKNVFLLFPCRDIDRSVEILMKRYVEPLHIATAEFLIRHKSYFELSKYQIYTENKTPVETADEIISIYNENDP